MPVALAEVQRLFLPDAHTPQHGVNAASPHVVAIEAWGRADAELFFALMEPCEGGELARAVGLAISDETLASSDAVWKLIAIVAEKNGDQPTSPGSVGDNLDSPTSPRGEVTGPACANRTLCAVPRALMAATTRGVLGVSRSSPGPTGAYPGHSQQGHTIPVPRVTSPRVARCNLAEQLLMAAGPLLWLFGSMALLDSVVWRLPFTPQPFTTLKFTSPSKPDRG